MSNLLRVEFYKFIRNKTFWILVMIISVLSFLLVLFPYLDDKGLFDQVESLTVEMNDQVTEQTELSGMKIFFEAIYSPDLFLTVLLISVLGAYFIASENSNGTIKNLVSIGYDRKKVYIIKGVIFSIGSILLIFLVSFIMGIFGALFLGIGEWPSSDLMIQTGKLIVLSSLYIVSFVAIVMFFSMNSRGSGLAVLLSFGFYLLTDTGLRMLSLKYKFGETLSEYSVYHQYLALFESNLGFSNIIELVTIPLLTAIIFTGLGLIVFQKKDIS